MYKAVCSTGELGNGRVKRRGTGTVYSSPSAARTAIGRYKGSEVFEVLPAGPIGSDDEPFEAVAEAPKKHGGARVRSGAQMPSGQKAVKRLISFDPEDLELVLALENGLSVGVRQVIQFYRDHKKPKK